MTDNPKSAWDTNVIISWKWILKVHDTDVMIKWQNPKSARDTNIIIN